MVVAMPDHGAKVLVKAKNPNLPVPRERHKPGMQMIVESTEVIWSLYYQRQLDAGDLELVKETK